MLRVLHLVGSPESKRTYDLSMLYARSCKSYGDFEFMYAVVRPDKMWKFADSLEESVVEFDDTEGKKDGEVMNMADALQHISSVIKPDAVIHHMFCQTGSTHYRCLIELLDMPLIGSSSTTISICKNKGFTKSVLGMARGVLMPKTVYVNANLLKCDRSAYKGEEIRREVGFPCVVKAVCIDDSLGVFLVKCEGELKGAIDEALQLDDEVVIEEFIPGAGSVWNHRRRKWFSGSASYVQVHRRSERTSNI